jgi:hypothetical protein
VKVMLAIAVGTTVLISREKTADYGRVEYITVLAIQFGHFRI